MARRRRATVPWSFITRWSVALPTSLKMVGTLTACPSTVCSTSVCTSDNRNPPVVVGSVPGAASSESMHEHRRRTSQPGDVSARHQSQQQTASAAVPALPIEPLRAYRRHLPCLCPSDLDDSRRDENQQLAALLGELLPLEQPAEQRNLVKPRRAVVLGVCWLVM